MSAWIKKQTKKDVISYLHKRMRTQGVLICLSVSNDIILEALVLTNKKRFTWVVTGERKSETERILENGGKIV